LNSQPESYLDERLGHIVFRFAGDTDKILIGPRGFSAKQIEIVAR
jgi:hypothetical protein